MDDRTLREYYTHAFRGIVQATQPGSVMSSYNRVNGVPAAADPYLIDTLLRQTFGFEGYVTSDCDAIFTIAGNDVRGHHWQPPGYDRPVNNTERHAFAMAAGEDANCQTGYRDNFNYLNQLPTAVDQGIPTLTDTFNVNDLDVSLTRLFTARMALGEFDPPEDVPWVTEARDRVPQGSWTNSDANGAVTQTPARLALAREAGAKSIVLLKNDGDRLPLDVPATGAFKVAVMGFFANPPAANTYLGGYSANQGPAGQAKTVNGFNGIKSAIQAINPAAQVDFHRGFTGTGTTAASLTAVDPAAVAAAAGYDAVIVYAGTDNGTAREDIDRTELTLPGAQGSLISQVAAQNPNTVVYMETIGPIDVSPWEADVPAILWSSYNGQRKGEALADVLLGTQNPSGRLPSIWYQSVSQIPSISDYRIRPQGGSPGRTHQYFDGALAYPFGYGLSYTDFDYDNIGVDDDTPDADATINVSVEVTNTGAVAGDDVVQLYATTPDATPAQERPRKRLVGFDKVALEPGQTKTVTLPLKIADLAFYDQSAHRWVVDPGGYGLQIARSSADGDVEQEADITVGGTLDAVPAVLSLKPALEGDAARGIQYRGLFPEGAVIEPNPTVAMKDDTLYGTVRKGHERPFPAGMTFAYTSNRPSVVKVDGGTLRTVRNGVATVTAKVTYGGVTRTREFVVRVVSELGGITVNGKPLSDVQPQSPFRPDDFHYEVVVPDGVTETPEVKATAPNPAAKVQVTQAPGIPGAATIDVTGPDGVELSYEVAFARSPKSDAFDGELGAQWRWIRHNPAKTSVTADAVVIKADSGDITSTPPGTTNTASNLLVQDAPGDWTIESELDFSVVPHVDNQQGGILAYEDDDNYLRLGWEYSGGQAQIAETIEDSRSGTSYPGFAQGSGARAQTLATVPTAGIMGDSRRLWLRMVKRGARYTTSYSTDGSTFTPLYETGASLRDAKVGVFAFNRGGVSSDLDLAVNSFAVSDRWPAAVLPPRPSGGGGGTPAPGGGPGPTPPGPPAGDTSAPRIRLLSAGRQRLSRLRGSGIAFRVGVDEPAALTVTLRGTSKGFKRRLARAVRRVALRRGQRARAAGREAAAATAEAHSAVGGADRARGRCRGQREDEDEAADVPPLS